MADNSALAPRKSCESWTAFFWFLVEYKLPFSTADHAAKRFRNMFLDSEIVNKCCCGGTKTAHMVIEAVAKQIISNFKEGLLMVPRYGSATDGTSDEDYKFLPVLVRYVDKASGLIATPLLDMLNINSGLTWKV